MDVESSAANAVIKQGIELSSDLAKILANLTASGFKNLAALIAAAVTPKPGEPPSEKHIHGQQNIVKLLSGHTPKVLLIPRDELVEFKAQAKQFNLPYAIADNPSTPEVDVVIREKDAALFARVIERMGYGKVRFQEEPQNPLTSEPVQQSPTSGNGSPRHESPQTASIPPLLLTATTSDEQWEHTPAGRIEYLDANGEVVSSVEFNDFNRLMETAKQSEGVPFRTVVYENGRESILLPEDEKYQATYRRVLEDGTVVNGYLPIIDNSNEGKTTSLENHTQSVPEIETTQSTGERTPVGRIDYINDDGSITSFEYDDVAELNRQAWHASRAGGSGVQFKTVIYDKELDSQTPPLPQSDKIEVDATEIEAIFEDNALVPSENRKPLGKIPDLRERVATAKALVDAANVNRTQQKPPRVAERVG